MIFSKPERPKLFASLYAWLRCTKAVTPVGCVLYMESVSFDQIFIHTTIYFQSTCIQQGLPQWLSGLLHCTATELSTSLAKVPHVYEEGVITAYFFFFLFVCLCLVCLYSLLNGEPLKSFSAVLQRYSCSLLTDYFNLIH